MSPTRSWRLATLTIPSFFLLPSLVGCPDKQPPPVDEPRVEVQPWENRWTGSFTAYIRGGTPEDAFDICRAMAEATDAVYGGTPVFTQELSARGYTDRDLDGDEGLEELETLRASEQGRFCHVVPQTAESQALAAAQWNQLLDWAEVNKVDLMPDVPNTVPLGLGDSATETASLVGAVDPLLTSSSRSPVVHVVVADTEPTGTYDPQTAGKTEHGTATARIVYSLLCDPNKSRAEEAQTNCSVQISTQHALPYEIDDTKQVTRLNTGGGQYGTHYSLAQAIDRATRDYTRTRIPTILNLSLGWNAGYSTPIDIARWKADLATDTESDRLARIAMVQRPGAVDEPYARWDRGVDDVTGSERLVYEALVRARCEGIIPVASAGNRTNFPTPEPELQEGPLLPAGWMVHTSSGTDECSGRGYASTSWDTDEPLVYAVSGVDRQARPVGFGRPQSNAPLAALALGVTVPDANLTDEKFHSISGTSASASVATAAMAAAWARDPRLDGDQVMQAVYGSGTPALHVETGNPVSADFGSIGSDTRTQIVQICDAAEAIRSVSPCPSTSARLSATSSSSGSGATVTATPMAAIDCAANPSTPPCSAQYGPTPDALRDVWPQPPTDPCPPCELEVTTAPSANFEGILTIRTPEADPFWQKGTFNTVNTITGYHVELTSILGQTRVASYTTPSQRALFEGAGDTVEVALTTSINVYSATLVLDGRNNITGAQKSWNVPLPVSKP